MNLQVDDKLKEEPILPKESQIELSEGVAPLTSLYMYIAGSCNLACRHCWIEPNYIPAGKGGQFIPVEYVDKAIQEALPLGLRSIKLTGGEPTLHPKFREILTIIDQYKLEIIIETNGTLVDADLAHFIKNVQHFAFISVSLDGANAETHESLRLVSNSFDKAVAGIRNLVKEGIHPQMICTLHKGNVNQIKDILYLAKDLGCSSVKFNHLQKSGRGEIMAEKEALSIPELIGIYNYIETELTTLKQIPVFFDIPFAFRPLHSLMERSLGTCNVLNILGILSGGEISLCGIGVTIPGLIYGHISRNNLADIWIHAEGLQSLRKLVPFSFEGICGNCLHRDLCMGSCVAKIYHDTKQLNRSFEFCEKAEELGLFPKSRKKYC